jgi:hypothetical protein
MSGDKTISRRGETEQTSCGNHNGGGKMSAKTTTETSEQLRRSESAFEFVQKYRGELFRRRRVLNLAATPYF